MAEEKRSLGKELTKGFLKENPVLRLVLGTCPTLATTTSVVNGIGMGIAATIVLICSNVAISAMRKIIPAKARIPAYIVIIASFVTMVQMLVKAFVPALDKSLGVFLPLIVVNCIILGRAEAFASKNPVLASAVDGLGMGIGFTAALFCMGTVREILGAGTFLSGIDTMLGAYIDLGTFKGFDFSEGLAAIGLAPMTIFILPAGGFFVFGMLMALANKLAERKGLKSATLNGCQGCPHASFCTKLNGTADSAECKEKSEPEKKSDNAKNDKEIKKNEEKVKTEEKAEKAPGETPEEKPEATPEENTEETSEEKTEETPEAENEDASEEKTEETPEAENEDASEEKTEDAPEAENEDASEEKTEDAPEAENKDASEEKTEDAPEEKTEETPEEKNKENSEEKTEETPVINTTALPAEKTAPVHNKKNRSRKKDKKAQQKAAIKEAFDTPIPETVPDFLKTKANDKKEENE